MSLAIACACLLALPRDRSTEVVDVPKDACLGVQVRLEHVHRSRLGVHRKLFFVEEVAEASHLSHQTLMQQEKRTSSALLFHTRHTQAWTDTHMSRFRARLLQRLCCRLLLGSATTALHFPQENLRRECWSSSA